MRMIRLFLSAVTMVLVAVVSSAVVAEDEAIRSGDTAWLMTSTALVLFMTIPGLALFYAGMVRAKNAVSVMMQSAPLLPPPPAPRSRANHARANHARSISANPSIVGIGVPRAVVRQTSLVSLIEFDSGALEREGSQSDCGPRGSELSDASDVGDGYDDDDDDGLASSDHARHRQVFSQDEATLDRALGDLRIEDSGSGSGLRSMRRSVSSTSVLMHRPPEPATSGYPRFRAKELIGGPPSASVDNSDEMTELRDVYIEVGRKGLKVYVKGALSFVPDQEIMVYSHKYGHIDQFHVLEQRQRFQYSIGSDASAVAALPITHSASWALGGSEAGGETGTDKQVPSPTAAAAREGFVFSTPQAVELHNAILDQIAKLLHPFMPFITEELWHAQAEFQGGERPYELMLAAWPDPQAEVDADAVAAIDWVIALTTAVRGAKSELGIAPGAKLEAWLPAPSPLATRVVERSAAAIERLARLTPLHLSEEAPAGAAMQVAAGEDAFIIPLEGHVDVEAEKARLTKAVEASQKEFGSLDKRLSNPSFVEKAKPEAVEKAKADATFHASEIDRLLGSVLGERVGSRKHQ